MTKRSIRSIWVREFCFTGSSPWLPNLDCVFDTEQACQIDVEEARKKHTNTIYRVGEYHRVPPGGAHDEK